MLLFSQQAGNDDQRRARICARRLRAAEVGRGFALSIRGSGLSRNFHLCSVQLYMDGISINTADSYGDFQEIPPRPRTGTSRSSRVRTLCASERTRSAAPSTS
jgi:hypothetical protein